jgi:hypothetical protein
MQPPKVRIRVSAIGCQIGDPCSARSDGMALPSMPYSAASSEVMNVPPERHISSGSVASAALGDQRHRTGQQPDR